MAKVVKRRGKWVIDYYDQHRKRHVETTYGNKREAEALLAERIQEVNGGTYQSKRDQLTFAELVEAYRAAHINVNLKPTTRRDYESKIRLYLAPYFQNLKIRNITVPMVEKFKADKLEEGKGRRTINKCLIVLGAMFRYAERQGWMLNNPASLVRKLPRTEQPAAAYMRKEDIPAFLEAADPQYRTLFKMAILCGLRQGELLGLQWGDIEWRHKRVHVQRSYTEGRFGTPKTLQSRRNVDLPDALIADLKQWRLQCPVGEHDLVFPNSDGKPMNSANMTSRGFKPALRRAGLGDTLRFHDLRHTYASLMLANNVNVKHLSSQMGHASIKITLDTYAHLMRSDDNQAANALAAMVLGKKSAGFGNNLVKNPPSVSSSEMEGVQGADSWEEMVAGDRIELPTRGFSILCSTN